MKYIFLHILLAIAVISKVTAQTINAPLYTPDRYVNAMVSKGDTLIVGGSFSHVGIYTGGLAEVTTSNDQPNTSFPRLDMDIVSSCSDGNGGYYVLNYDGYLLHILSNNTFDPGFINIQVSNGGGVEQNDRIVYYNGVVYIGLNQANINGANLGHLSAYDVMTQQFVTTIPYVNGSISNLRIHNNKLYIMGGFDTVSNTARYHIAAIDMNSYTVTNWYPQLPTQSFAPDFTDIVFWGADAIIGGYYPNNGFPVNVAKCVVVDTASGAFNRFFFYGGGLFGGPLNNMYWAATLKRMAILNNELYIATTGTFDTRITACNLLLDSNYVDWARFFNMTANVKDIVVSSGTVYISGDAVSPVYALDSTNDNTSNIVLQNARNAVAFNAVSGAIVNWHPDPVGLIYNAVKTMCLSGNKILLGGYFSHLKGEDRQSLYAYKTSTEQVLPLSISVAFLGEINGLKLLGDTLYIAGSWDSTYGGNSYATVRGYDINNGQQLLWYPSYLGTAEALEANNQYVFVAGNVQDTSNGITKDKLLAIDRTTGQVINWAPNPNGIVRALHISDGKLYVGGSFTSIDGQNINNLASFDLSSLNLSTFQPSDVNDVYCLNSDDSLLYVGGVIDNFDTLNNLDRFIAIRKSDGALAKYAVSPSTGPAPNGAITDIAFKEKTLITVSSNTGSNSDTCGAPFVYKGTSGIMTRNNDVCVNLDNGTAKLYAAEIIGNDLYYGGKFNTTNGMLVGPNLGRISYPSGYFNTLTKVVDPIDNLIVSVYPNPNNGQFTVTLPKGGEPATITITNIMGAKLWEKTTKQSKVVIKLNQPSGVYFLAVTTNMGISVQKIVID